MEFQTAAHVLNIEWSLKRMLCVCLCVNMCVCTHTHAHAIFNKE